MAMNAVTPSIGYSPAFTDKLAPTPAFLPHKTLLSSKELITLVFTCLRSTLTGFRVSGTVGVEVNAAGPLQWEELTGIVAGLHPSPVWDSLTPDLYTTFWSLSVQDIHCPVDA